MRVAGPAAIYVFLRPACDATSVGVVWWQHPSNERPLTTGRETALRSPMPPGLAADLLTKLSKALAGRFVSPVGPAIDLAAY